MKKQHRVALLIESSNAYGRGLLAGVVAYVREHRPWSLYFVEQGRGDPPPKWLHNWDGDGIIARIENKQIAEAVIQSKLPAVDISAARLIPSIPWFETHDAAISKLVATHLQERGFKHFGFCGDTRFNWSNWRCESFVSTLRDAGFDCSVYQPFEGQDSCGEIQNASIGMWLSKLPKPIGIMACYDIRAQQALSACRDQDLAVPDEVSVVGVDNDEVLCNLCSPPLSSVQPNNQLAGYEAARFLDRMMSGHKVAPSAHLVEPVSLIVRQSSDVLAIHDTDVARSMNLIRKHACDGIDVSDVLKQVAVSRRILENRFKRLLGVTPHQEILRVKINRVKQLLADTNLNIAEIARRTGFEHVEYLSVTFKRETGSTLREYRKKLQKIVVTPSSDASEAADEQVRN